MTCPVCQSETKPFRGRYPLYLNLLQCNMCGLIFQANPPEEKDLLKIYNNTYCNCWGVKSDFEVLRMIKLRSSFAYLDVLKKYLPHEIDKPRILDIGCSYGFMLEAANHYKLSAVGIEISSAAEFARKSGCVVYDKPLEELKITVNSFDIITIIDVLEHIFPNPLIFDKIIDALKDNGLLFIMTPNIDSVSRKLLGTKWPHYKSEHLIYFSKKSLSILLRRNGFIPEKIQTGFKYLSIGYIFRHFIQYGSYNSKVFTMKTYRLMPSFLKNMIIKIPTGLIAISKKDN